MLLCYSTLLQEKGSAAAAESIIAAAAAAGAGMDAEMQVGDESKQAWLESQAGSTILKDPEEDAQRLWQAQITAQCVAVEILTNLCTSGLEEDGDSDQEGQACPTGNDAILEAFVRCGALPAVMSMAAQEMPASAPWKIVCSLLKLQERATLCVGNMFQVLPAQGLAIGKCLAALDSRPTQHTGGGRFEALRSRASTHRTTRVAFF